MQRALKEIIGKYPKVLQDEKLLKALLKDYFPENKRMQNMLVMVLDSGILADIVQKDEIIKFQMLGYIKCLANDYGVSEKSAKDVVELWLSALEKQFDSVNIIDDATTNNTKRKNEVSIIDYSKNSIDDYKIKDSVIRIKGKGQKVIPNVKINNVTYIVKAKNCNVNAYDSMGEDDIIVSGMYEDYTEDVYKPCFVNTDKPVLLKIESDDTWELEMIPFTD